MCVLDAQKNRVIAGVPTCADQKGDGTEGPDPPWEITKIKGSLTILVRIPLKSQSYQSSIQFEPSSARHQTPFKWRYAGGSMKARL